MESKYNLLTRLLKNIKNVVTPDGSVAGGVPVVHTVTEETVALTGTLPDVAGYQWIPQQSSPSNEVTTGPFIRIDYDASDNIPEVFIKRTNLSNWQHISSVIDSSGKIDIDVSGFGMDGEYPSEDYFNGALIKVVSETSIRLDKTYKELVDSGFFVAHFPSGPLPKLPNWEIILLIPCGFFGDDRGCRVSFLEAEGGCILAFVASTENDYPVLQDIRVPSNGESSLAK